MGEAMQQGLKQRGLKFAGAAAFLALASFAAGEAQATEGYFQYGYGARQGGLAGAGVADSRDAMALSLNPAGLVDVGRQWQFGASLFMPYRSYTATGTNLVSLGKFDSAENYFVIPNIAYNNPIDANSAWGFAVFGNGGMNTNWPVMPRPFLPTNFCPPLPGIVGTGTYCGGQTGVDMMQAFIALGYARRFGALSFGISPVLAIQRVKIQGLSAYGVPGTLGPFSFGFSSDPTKLTNNGYSWSYGGGVRVGVQWSVMPNFRIGFSGQTPMWMTKFSKYSGLFADHGYFDIPANLTAGVAWDAMPALTLMVDYKHIFYGSIQSIAATQAVPLPLGSLGLPNATGFGWHDIDIIKVGAEWRASPVWTFRVGYAHNASPIKSTDVTFNIIAPGVVTDHITGGFAYKVNANSTFEFAAAYVPSHSVSGIELTPFGPTPASNIELSMHQYQFTFGYTYEFAPPAPTKMVHR
jgi:long-chain fatty acid transport protein